MRKLGIAWLAASLCLLAVAPPPPGAKATARIGEWSLQTDELIANLQTGDFSAPHHVFATRSDGSTIDADRGTGNYKKRLFNLYGNVTIHDQSGTFGGLSSAQQNASRGPSTLASDELHVDGSTKIYTAAGNVQYVQGATTADADGARLNDRLHQLDLDGHVHVVQDQRTLDAAHATYDTLSDDGVASGDVKMVFPGMIHASIATPKPIVIKNPKIH
jgi:lipopolysaccharide assembly outer membrane protein LptD (OstA)